MNKKTILFAGFLLLVCSLPSWADSIKLGFNYPQTGRYKDLGLQQRLAAFLAVEEINSAGGILGKDVELVIRNTAGSPERGVANTRELITQENVDMLFGGASSAVAIASGKAAKELGRLYFGTTTSANATTGSEGHDHMFREYPNAWMTGNALGSYLTETFGDAKYFYVTADYTWGKSSEASLRNFTNTSDTEAHPNALTPFPGAFIRDFQKALSAAEASGADILMLVLFGDDLVRALNVAHDMGLKDKMKIVSPNISLGIAHNVGATIMEDLISTTPWEWMIPYQLDYERGQQFVEAFTEEYGLRPTSTAATTYGIIYQYKDAVERAGTTDTQALIRALEGYEYTLLKDRQQWRAFDHQNLQTIYVVRSKKREQVISDPLRSDFFEVVGSLEGEKAAQTLTEWRAERAAANKPPYL
ncbi:amino acid/amide ABC transporter substrate-binding protein, HAAT family [Marinobacter daqiaonensis]|uniref:Amino acid/amide ABC transporter substrate-binding protein, HAAT family n=1 Tax=Marinobacter daqiaonensis TaxID=650891 RepID=A0A1I6I3D6_9GAMM|nr:ABC transporter substrate-binding protein [Marinobacter daqiaonensis]SFR61148.1 amino acid/amide ABC transporter substrate-binding protein, HAAT family [Marinobacter daqiaonensis]